MTHRSTTILVTLALIAASCGGGDSTPAETPTTEAKATTTQALAETPEATTTAPPTTEAAPPAAEGMATVTVGDITWEFPLTGDPREQCFPDLGGTFLFAAFKEEAGNQLAVWIEVPDSGPIEVQAGSPLITEGMWIADESVYDRFPDLDPGVGGSATKNGNTVSGTATFYEDRSLTETLQTGDAYATGLRTGTFTATCPSA